MRLAVCVKQVPAANEQRLDPVTGTAIRAGVASILNPFDAHALEEAVQLKRLLGGHVTVSYTHLDVYKRQGLHRRGQDSGHH